MHQILTIARLTWKSAFRYRLFWVMAVLLMGAVVGFPLLLKDDGTAQGLTQILLTYTLSAITALLGIFTLWLACGTLARDVEECQMQVVSVKPIARWQIWVGKWVGIIGLNVALVALSGTSVYMLLKVRASRLPAEQQAILNKEIFVARGSAKPPKVDVDDAVEKRLQEILKRVPNAQVDPTYLRKEAKKMVMAERQAVLPNVTHRFVVDLGSKKDHLRDVPLQLRVKFHSANEWARDDALYVALWRIGPPESAKAVELEPQRLPGGSFQVFDIPANLFDDTGKLTIDFLNANNEALLFEDDGMEVLYREGGFALNFARGLCIVLCWLALLATIGLATASWLSFPVAAFASLTILILGLSGGTLSTTVELGTIMGLDHETRQPEHPVVDNIALPVFKGVLNIINLVENFSPVDSLSSGRSITWGELGLAVTQIVFLMGGLFAAVGVVLFNRRELAAVQSNS